VRELADSISESHVSGIPYGLLGHSMGALLAFDVAIQLTRIGFTTPQCVWVSARNPPHRTTHLEESELNDERLMQLLTSVGGVPNTLVSNRRFLAHYLIRFRNDLIMLRSRRSAEPAARLDCKIVAMRGEDDPAVSSAWLPEWGRYSHTGCEVLAFPGGHFFLHERPALVLRAIAGVLM
jgi:medium-chain acyl-[acyl-carrier-protein] hydrolase